MTTFAFSYMPLLLLWACRCLTDNSLNSFLLPHEDTSNTSEKPFTCQDVGYKTHILSKNPLVIYISSFVTPEETFYLMARAESDFFDSTVLSPTGSITDAKVRSSMTAYPPRDDVVRCIEDRARAFQGYGLSGTIEALQIVRYAVAAEYVHHYDWSETLQRESSFFVYLHANCTGGGTNFSRLKAPIDDETWCRFIDCDEPYDAGVTFKPIAGNAIFWQNLKPDGEGYPETLHAGLPVTSGTKIGLNIWTGSPRSRDTEWWAPSDI